MRSADIPWVCTMEPGPLIEQAGIVTAAAPPQVQFTRMATAAASESELMEAAIRTPMRLTGVLAKHAAGVWRWAPFHGGRPQPADAVMGSSG